MIVGQAESYLFFVNFMLCMSLAYLSYRDITARLLPNRVIYPLTLLAFFLPRELIMLSYTDQLVGILCGLSFIAAIDAIYQKLRDRPGIGMGDAKLFGCAGAYLGPLALPYVLVIALCSGIIVLLLNKKRHNTQDAIPFGPFLALGFIIIWFLSQRGTLSL